jgi:protein TonB
VAVQTFDVSLVPLSALDTVPPTGRPQQENKPLEEPKTIKQSKPLSLPSDAANAAPETKKPLTSEKKKIKTAPSADTSTQQPQQASAPSAASSIGATINGSNNNPTAEPARISYQDMVATMLARAKRYPERALRRQTTGDGTIRIKIDASGDVTDFEIVESTASPILDEELKDMVERASPFPPFPADLRRDNLALLVPVSFRLQQ